MHLRATYEVKKGFKNKNTQTIIFSQKELEHYRINRFPLILTLQ